MMMMTRFQLTKSYSPVVSMLAAFQLMSEAFRAAVRGLALTHSVSDRGELNRRPSIIPSPVTHSYSSSCVHNNKSMLITAARVLFH